MYDFNKSIVPLLRRMLNLEVFNLNIIVDCYEKFLDGDKVKVYNNITNHFRGGYLSVLLRYHHYMMNVHLKMNFFFELLNHFHLRKN
jgi:hypothetical protein